MAEVSGSNNKKDGSVVVNNRWIVDSGAGVHLSSNKMFFDEYKPYDGDFRLRGFNGSTSKAIGRGSVKLKMYDGAVVELKGVWHVPEARCNLISAGALNSCGFKLESVSDGTMNITRDSQVVMKATRLQNHHVYYLIGEAAYEHSHRVTINNNNNNKNNSNTNTNTNTNTNNNNNNNYSFCPLGGFALALLTFLAIAIVVSLEYVH